MVSKEATFLTLSVLLYIDNSNFMLEPIKIYLNFLSCKKDKAFKNFIPYRYVCVSQSQRTTSS
jgi:hypothetical protein